MERYCGRVGEDERKECVYLSLCPRKQGRKGEQLVEEERNKIHCINLLLRDKRRQTHQVIYSVFSFSLLDKTTSHKTASRTVQKIRVCLRERE